MLEIPLHDDFKIYKINEKTLEIILSKKNTLNDLFIFFNKNNIIITSIKNKVNRLEELFINITNMKEINTIK